MENLLQALLKTWIQIAFLIAPPHALPGDQRSMKIAVLAAVLSNVLVTLTLFNTRFLLAEALLDVVLAGLCLYFGLRLVEKSERFVQSFAAYCGVNFVVNVGSVLLLAPTSSGQPDDESGVVRRFLEFLLLVWSLAVVGHIARHAFSISTPASIAIAICYLLIYIQVASFVFGL